jgi:hypothetical protein
VQYHTYHSFEAMHSDAQRWLYDVFRGALQLDERIAAQALMLNNLEDGVPCPPKADKLDVPNGRNALTQATMKKNGSRNTLPLDATSGLRWRNVGGEKPSKGEELTNERLAEALQQKTEFTQAEFDAFSITGLRGYGFVKSGASYFQAGPSRQCLLEWVSEKVPDIERLVPKG